MTRDSAETGDPDTLQGQFPSELGSGGGGGGGGGTSEPTAITTSKLSNDLNGFRGPVGDGDPASRFLRWDNRPIGGTNYGIYAWDGNNNDFPFATGTSTIAPGGPTVSTNTISITTTVSLSGGYALAPMMSFFIGGAASATTTSLNIRQGITGLSPAPVFSRYSTGVSLNDWEFGRIYIPTGSPGANIANLPGILNIPRMYYEYQTGGNYIGATYTRYSPSVTNPPYRGPRGYFPGNRVQRGVMAQTDTTFNFHLTASVGGGTPAGFLGNITFAVATDAKLTPVTTQL